MRLGGLTNHPILSLLSSTLLLHKSMECMKANTNWSVLHGNADILWHCGARVGRGRAGNFQVLHQGTGDRGHKNFGQYLSINREDLFILDAIRGICQVE